MDRSSRLARPQQSDANVLFEYPDRMTCVEGVVSRIRSVVLKLFPVEEPRANERPTAEPVAEAQAQAAAAESPEAARFTSEAAHSARPAALGLELSAQTGNIGVNYSRRSQICRRARCRGMTVHDGVAHAREGDGAHGQARPRVTSHGKEQQGRSTGRRRGEPAWVSVRERGLVCASETALYRG